MKARSIALLFVLGITALTSHAVTLDYKYSGVPIRTRSDAEEICPRVCAKADMTWQGAFGTEGLCLCQKNP